MKGTDDQPARLPHELPDLVEPSVRPEMDSVTDVHGTVARFDMAYSPVVRRAMSFGPPLRQRLPSLLFCVFGGVLVALVLTAYYVASSNSSLYIWIVDGDRSRPLPAVVLATMVFLSAIGTVIRATCAACWCTPTASRGATSCRWGSRA